MHPPFLPVAVSATVQSVLQKCIFSQVHQRRYISFVQVIFSHYICCRCVLIAISGQSSNFSNQYPTCNSWTHRSVASCGLLQGETSMNATMRHFKRPMQCLWGRTIQSIFWGWPSQEKAGPISLSWGEPGFSQTFKLQVEQVRWIGCHSKLPTGGPRLTPDHRHHRLIWVRRHQTWNHQVHYVIFADDSKFSIYHSNGHAWVRWCVDVRLVDCCIQETDVIHSSPFITTGNSDLIWLCSALGSVASFLLNVYNDNSCTFIPICEIHIYIYICLHMMDQPCWFSMYIMLLAQNCV